MVFDKIESCIRGRLGGVYVSDTSVNTGKFGVIQALTDCTFTTLTSPTQSTIANAASMTLLAGQRLYGYWTTVTLAGGTAVLYNAE